MCEYQELAFTECGFIIRCRHCQQYQVCFAGIVLTLSESEFSHLLRHIAQSNVHHAGMKGGEERSILISTPKAGVQIIVSKNELDQLQQLAEAAEVEITVLDLLALFR